MTTRVRHRQPPNPFGCRWCGTDRHHHGRSYVASKGMHGWEQPTTAQVLARMRARRTNRTRRPVANADRRRAVHADVYCGPQGDEDPVCATCHRNDCPKWTRIQTRLDQQDRQRWEALPVNTFSEDPW